MKNNNNWTTVTKNLFYPLILFLLSLVLTACGGGGSGDTSGTSTSLSLTPPTPSTTVKETSTEQVTEQVTALSPVMQVDQINRLIYLPDQGWLNEDQFWDIYYNEPQKLPGTIDFEALHQLGYREAPIATDNNGGDA